MTKVQIVLGRTNPNLKANEAFAKQVKAVVDKKYPGLIKGIFYGDGKYNQDLSLARSPAGVWRPDQCP